MIRFLKKKKIKSKDVSPSQSSMVKVNCTDIVQLLLQTTRKDISKRVSSWKSSSQESFWLDSHLAKNLVNSTTLQIKILISSRR